MLHTDHLLWVVPSVWAQQPQVTSVQSLPCTRLTEEEYNIVLAWSQNIQGGLHGA